MNATTAKCEICNVRPVPSTAKRDAAGMSRDMKYCVPCFEEANWENTHNDYGHDENSKTIVPQGDDESGHRVEGCWICFPELNEAKREYTPRQGTSREGMVVHVTIRATGVEKAAQVIEQLPNPEMWATKVTKPTKRNGHITKLVIESAQETYTLRWDFQGRFVDGTVEADGRARKVRNVAEVLRLAR